MPGQFVDHCVGAFGHDLEIEPTDICIRLSVEAVMRKTFFGMQLRGKKASACHSATLSTDAV
jgi:hypothetical protein